MSIAQIRLETAKSQGAATGQATMHYAEDEAALAQMLLRGMAIEDDRYVVGRGSCAPRC